MRDEIKISFDYDCHMLNDLLINLVSHGVRFDIVMFYTWFGSEGGFVKFGILSVELSSYERWN